MNERQEQVAANAQATISFSAPASNGGSAISGYTVTSTPGGLTATGSASPITIGSLVNGTQYTFAVTANNIAGSSIASAASNVVTPSAIPAISLSVTGFTVALLYSVQPVNNASDGLVLGGHAQSVTAEWKADLPDDHITSLLVNEQ